MDFSMFAPLVGVLAVVYAVIARSVQNKLINRSEMEEFQKESRRLSEEFEQAKKAGNKKKMDEIMQKQMEFLPKMNGLMVKQFKPMIVILIIFFAFTWLVGSVDPFIRDDITLDMLDNGKGCDKTAGDGVFTACYPLNNSSYGKWGVAVKAFANGAEIGANHTYFAYGLENITDTYVEDPKGEPVGIALDKTAYAPGETAMLSATSAKATEMKAILDSSTSFRVDLPLTIPIVNVKSFYQPYWWFIFISLITNLGVSFVWGKIRKKKEEEKK